MIDEKKLEERLTALEAAKPWSPRVISRLETVLRSADDDRPLPHQSDPFCR